MGINEKDDECDIKDEELLSEEENQMEEGLEDIDIPSSQEESEESQEQKETQHDEYGNHSKDPQIDEENQMKEIAKKEKEKLKQIRSARKKILEDMRKEQNRQIAVDQKQSAKERLRYLLQQTEIFSHFISGKKGTVSDIRKTPTKRGRKTEKEEDEEMLQENLEEKGSGSSTAMLTVQPPFVKGTMRDYQLYGLNWLIKLYDNGINGILADEMGLGKTLQTVAFLCYLKECRAIHGPHMVIAPKSTLSNWMNEFRKWCPSMNVFKFHGNKEERMDLKKEKLLAGKFDVCITSYEIAIIEKAALKKFSWRYLVIDEAHRIKNEKSLLSKIVRLYRSQYRLLLTGTPLQNNLHELWALLNFLLPEVFSSSEDFDSWFDLSNKSEEHQEIIQRLHKVLGPFLLRRLKSDVEHALPPKKEIKLFVGMSMMQKEWYVKILRKDWDVLHGVSNKREGKMRLLNIVMQLRKACNHPYLFDGAEPTPYTNGEHLITNAGKMVVLDKLLPKLKQQDSRVLIFSQMTRLLDILEDYLVYRNYEYCRIDGSTTSEDRELSIEEFNKENSRKFVFLLSTRAGGLGINLASADIVILYDSDWNPQVDLQAQDRAHRIGQRKPVTVFRFVTEGAVEEKVVERAEAKLHLDALVIQQGRLIEQNKALTQDEMMSMIHFGANEIIGSKESTITDDEIDLILKRGEEKTEALNENMKKNSVNDLNFSLDGGGNLYEFQGVDYSKTKKFDPRILGWIEPSKRERKANYAIDDYYRAVLRTAEPRRGHVSRPPKQPVIYDFQFFPPRLAELLEKETALYQRKMELEKKKENEQMQSSSTTTTTPTTTANTTSSTDSIESSVESMTETEPLELTPEEQAEKESLLNDGFLDWSRREFNAFTKACERYGRYRFAEIAAEIETKTEKEVRQYSNVFWKKYKEINDYERIVKNIEKGEAKLRRVDEMTNAMQEKLSRYKNPWRELKFVYGQNKGKAYTEEEDQFLICMTQKLGYGSWDQLKTEIRKSWQFRFDWFLKSRTPQELSRRVDSLIRLIEKENQELNERERENGDRRRRSIAEERKRQSFSSNLPESIRKRRKAH